MKRATTKVEEKIEIRRAVELRGLGAAARKCGVSHTHLRKVIQGERKPSAKLWRKMCALGLDCAAVVKGGK